MLTSQIPVLKNYLRHDEGRSVLVIEADVSKLAQPSKPPHVRSVRVVAVLPEAARFYTEGQIPIRAGQVFNSAVAASRALGFGHNAVSLRLNKRAKRGLATVKIRGFEFEYCTR
jgi:hypothetical protein